MPGSNVQKDGANVLLFGPLSLSLSPSTLDALRKTIHSSPRHAWVERVLASLSVQYSNLCTEVPALNNEGHEAQVGDLAAWLKTGDLGHDVEQLPNALLAPLVIIAQLVQYRDYADNYSTAHGQPKIEETAGFCIGLLSAFAVSLSHRTTSAEFARNAGVAVHLAMLSGAVVDRQDVLHAKGASKTFSVAWKRTDAGDKSKELENVLTNFPEAYVSVVYDITRVSLTTSISTSEALQEALQDAGFNVTNLGLSGRFHSRISHNDKFRSIIDFCDNSPAFKFPSSTALRVPIKTDQDGISITQEESLHGTALESILLQKCEWYTTISTLKSTLLSNPTSRLVTFGERCIPSSLLNGLNGRLVQSEDIVNSSDPATRENPNDVAVIGMSINVAGADSASEFWDILAAGKSQHRQVTDKDFSFETAFRENDPKRKWFGNFMNNTQEFDHKFFKKTPRESTGMDPQQRLLLQCTYQALEMAGYFNKDNGSSTTSEAADTKNIGCYVGMCGNDYVTNTSHHAANAFTATGTLRSFVAGKLSHYFGWLGPALTLDTACSASAVAIHSACRAIISGEVTAAIAGGTNTISEPGIFQNLAGASFLSPTGSCKPFDASADGYCRGEAVSALLLKSLAQARKDGDMVLGVIAGTAVAQNSNDTPIVVPNAPSLSTLFHSVLGTAKLNAQDVSVVEAHGTGTPVGDPAEYAAIRRIFGQEKGNGIKRTTPLQLGSVKGLVGHTEGTSGAVALIKVLCMLQEASIPPQASHTKINPSIGAGEKDGIQISKSLKRWEADFKAVLINNYGASGSNASMVVTQAPVQKVESGVSGSKSNVRYPFWFSGLDDRSIRAYTAKLRDYLQQKPNISIADLAFNVARQSNRTLPRGLLLGAQSTSELIEKLAGLENKATASIDIPAPRPVIMCFGGQISTSVGLDRAVYDNTALFRQHMDRCNELAIALGAGTIFPVVFQSAPIADIVLLQAALFASQYSAAKCWMTCGVEPVAVMGHSFGELTALCVSGVLEIEDAMKLIIGRATVIRDFWGTEKGAMVAIEATPEKVAEVLGDVDIEHNASIACYNGPKSHTVAGSMESVDAVVEVLKSTHSELRYKKLCVSNAFHSSLVMPIRSRLQEIGKSLNFHKAVIPIERALEHPSAADNYTTDLVADHLLKPVYFSQAVQRLAKKYPSAIWLEAGSNSTITSMASKVLDASPAHHFQGVNISNGQGLQRLTDVTLSLWGAGIQTAYWGHSRAQTQEFKAILLPPYQFEKKRHWLELKEAPKAEHDVCERPHMEKNELPTKLYTFTGYQDTEQRQARFRINTMIPQYHDIVAGHTIAGAAPICPATVQIDIAIEALRSLDPQLSAGAIQPQIRDVVNHVPVCVDSSRTVWLDVEALDASRMNWIWKWVSTGATGTTPTVHCDGEIDFRNSNDSQYKSEFSRYNRLVTHRRCVRILQGEHADELLQGQRSIYRSFSPIVQYSSLYFGLTKLVGQDSESAGRVMKKHSGESWLDPFLADAFCQVAGIWVNCMNDENEDDMWIANGIEQWIRAPLAKTQSSSPGKWHVFGQHSRSDDGNTVLSDLFVFEGTTGALVEVISGIKYARVAKASMGKLLTRLTPEKAGITKSPEVKPVAPKLMTAAEVPAARSSSPHPSSPRPSSPRKAKKATSGKAKKSADDVDSLKNGAIKRLKAILADISGLEPAEIKDDVELGDIGVDSLMGMEMAREIEKEFGCQLPQDELVHVTDFPGLLHCLGLATGMPLGGSDSSSASASDDVMSCGSITPSITPLSSPESESDYGLCDLKVPQSSILKAFGESKLQTDKLIDKYASKGYLRKVAPYQDELVVALTVEAFEELGCHLEAIEPGHELHFIPHAKDQMKFAQYLYTVLEKAQIIEIDDGVITRGTGAVPETPSSDLLADLLEKFPDHACCNELAYYTGSHLAGILSGRQDGIKLIFGTERGRELVGGVYADFPINKLYYEQMGDFLRRLALSTPQRPGQGPLKILEMGAGTGATTQTLLPLLASLGVEVEYTFTDLSSSFIAAARKKFKQYSHFMKFRVHDIEKAPVDDLLHSQHVVIASNAVHATRSLPKSTANIKKMLRTDGVLLLLEMTQPMYWCDIIFGVFEGWWLFEDGRDHAVTSPQTWEKSLHSVGYGHVDWSDGHSEEVKCERLIMATAGGDQQERLPIASKPKLVRSSAFRHDERRVATDKIIRDSTAGFAIPHNDDAELITTEEYENCILITGATGSLGCHMVAHYANLPTVSSIVCLNRRSNAANPDPLARQLESLSAKDLHLSSSAQAKISAYEVDTTKPLFSLSPSTYESLLNKVTHIVHNAWPMNAKQPLQAFTPQFRVLRHFLDMAAQISSRRTPDFKLGFEFISSIATVGHYPIQTGEPCIPEETMKIEYVLPNGYGDAKFICERMIDETLHQYPKRFNPMVVRPGQIAGSSASGYWNENEHLPFLIKSSQTLNALPQLDGPVSWTPVDRVAGICADLVLGNDGVQTRAKGVYHVDNPIRQPWSEMLPLLAAELDIPDENIVPFEDWIQRVRDHPVSKAATGKQDENPARRLVDFLEADFRRMSCGGVLLGTERCQKDSRTMAQTGPVSGDVVAAFVESWRQREFLL